jgi:hypothetical protein
MMTNAAIIARPQIYLSNGTLCNVARGVGMTCNETMGSKIFGTVESVSAVEFHSSHFVPSNDLQMSDSGVNLSHSGFVKPAMVALKITSVCDLPVCI